MAVSAEEPLANPGDVDYLQRARDYLETLKLSPTNPVTISSVQKDFDNIAGAVVKSKDFGLAIDLFEKYSEGLDALIETLRETEKLSYEDLALLSYESGRAHCTAGEMLLNNAAYSKKYELGDFERAKMHFEHSSDSINAAITARYDALDERDARIRSKMDDIRDIAEAKAKDYEKATSEGAKKSIRQSLNREFEKHEALNESRKAREGVASEVTNERLADYSVRAEQGFNTASQTIERIKERGTDKRTGGGLTVA